MKEIIKRTEEMQKKERETREKGKLNEIHALGAVGGERTE